ncbi:hypothetical protein [Polyangium jinanense]|uniref:Lipoprotein n=1 Tax=Polyangium jinanense TaxID=2829994 RepID=A0A9X3XEX5_9BACT|nr:hypothetical protein [Polyangium jinanense]MDC3959754.1 hypothetical protein [Polyangium jinanense]MDC3988917.1 hypothetical protein [Polyangium jinanense]
MSRWIGLCMLFCLAPIACVASPAAEGEMEDALDEAISTSASALTTGTEELFESDIKVGALTATQIRTKFASKPATFGNFMLGMRERACGAGGCGVWQGATVPVYEQTDALGSEYDFSIGMYVNGWTQLKYGTGTNANNPVVHGTAYVTPAGYSGQCWMPFNGMFKTASGKTTAPVSLYYHCAANGQTAQYRILPKLTNTAMNAQRFIARSDISETTPHPDGSYWERQYVIYARLDPAETTTLVASDDGSLLASW